MKPDKEIATNLLLRRGIVIVHLDPRHPDVIVPPWLRYQPHLALAIGHDMPIPIPNLRVDEDGISGTLSFAGTQYFCFLPWSAVFALADERKQGRIWPESIPTEVLGDADWRKAVTPKQTLKVHTNDNPTLSPPRGRLKLVC